MESLLFEDIPEGSFLHPMRRDIAIPTYVDEILSKTLPTYENLNHNFHTYTDILNDLPSALPELNADHLKEAIDKLLMKIPITPRISVTCSSVKTENDTLNLALEITCPRIGGNYEAFKARLSYPYLHQIQIRTIAELKEKLKNLYITAVLCMPIAILQACAIRDHHKHLKAAYVTKCASIFLTQSDTTHAEVGFDQNGIQDWLTILHMSIDDLCDIYKHSCEDICGFAMDLILPAQILRIHQLSPLTLKFDVAGLFEQWQSDGTHFSDLKLAFLTGDEYDHIEVFTAHLSAAIRHEEGLCVVTKNNADHYLVIDFATGTRIKGTKKAELVEYYLSLPNAL